MFFCIGLWFFYLITEYAASLVHQSDQSSNESSLNGSLNSEWVLTDQLKLMALFARNNIVLLKWVYQNQFFNKKF